MIASRALQDQDLFWNWAKLLIFAWSVLDLFSWLVNNNILLNGEGKSMNKVWIRINLIDIIVNIYYIISYLYVHVTKLFITDRKATKSTT